MAQLVEDAARAREDEVAARDYINEILEKIEKGEIEVARYPLGAPSLKAVNDLALQMEREQKKK